MPTKKPLETTEMLIGIDYGEANTGVAMGRNGLVVPIQVLSNTDVNFVVTTLIRLALENKVNKFILGLPVNSEDKETNQSLAVRKFGKLLRVRSKKQVEFYNENYSTKEAVQETVSFGLSQKGRRLADHYSAALILKRYFDNLAQKIGFVSARDTS